MSGVVLLVLAAAASLGSGFVTVTSLGLGAATLGATALMPAAGLASGAAAAADGGGGGGGDVSGAASFAGFRTGGVARV